MLRKMPKVELHAHLAGSLSENTVKKLIDKKCDETGTTQDYSEILQAVSIEYGKNRTLAECFQMFKVVHSLLDSEDSLYTAVCDVIDEFMSDGVLYLELRSTPREIPERSVTKRSYIQTIIRAIQAKTSAVDGAQYGRIIVRYIVAIDRRNTVEYAEDTVNLAIEFADSTGGLVVGVDLSGDGTVNDARNFLPVLKKAKDAGLKLSLHLAEVSGLEDETSALLDLKPDRIGHGTFIHPESGGSDELLTKVQQHQIPIELCLTSNIKGQIVSSYADHHMKHWYDIGHPICLCTDDKGVFATDLSEEYRYAADAFNLDKGSIMNLCRSSFEYIFESDNVKAVLLDVFDKWRSAHI